MELADIVCPPDPDLFSTMGQKAVTMVRVTTVRVACCYNEYIVWNGLKGEERNTQDTMVGIKVDHLHFHQKFCQ